MLRRKVMRYEDFKTSHVIVYPHSLLINQSANHHFKTSHVIVYHHQDSGNACRYAFQNISCYCLSIKSRRTYASKLISKHLMLLFILIQLRDCLNEAIFQNISCYCLSL